MIDTTPDIEQFPYRLEITDLNTGQTSSKCYEKDIEPMERLKECDEENFFMALWNRLTQEVIGSTHAAVA